MNFVDNVAEDIPELVGPLPAPVVRVPKMRGELTMARMEKDIKGLKLNWTGKTVTTMPDEFKQTWKNVFGNMAPKGLDDMFRKQLKAMPDSNIGQKLTIWGDKFAKSRLNIEYVHGAEKNRIVFVDRAFYRNKQNQLIVQHNNFEVHSAAQGQGYAKQYMKASMDMYRQLGVDMIHLRANLDVGGYAWAKYGFAPTNPAKLGDELEAQLRRWAKTKRELTGAQEAMVKKLVDRLKAGDETAVWAIADITAKTKSGQTIGKALLKGSDWYGELKITNQTAMHRFYQYVGPKVKAKPKLSYTLKEQASEYLEPLPAPQLKIKKTGKRVSGKDFDKLGPQWMVAVQDMARQDAKGLLTRAWNNLLGDTDPKSMQRMYATLSRSIGKRAEITQQPTLWGYATGHDQLSLNYTGRAGGAFRANRTFFKTKSGQLWVEHDEFILPKSVQGSGAAKDYLRASMDVYRQLGVSRVQLTANIDRGGYAWLKYGFRPDSIDDTKDLGKALLADFKAEKYAAVDPATRKAFTKLLKRAEKGDDEALWALVDTKVKITVRRQKSKRVGGREELFYVTEETDLATELLKFVTWKGHIDLDDPIAMQRFYNYVRIGHARKVADKGKRLAPPRVVNKVSKAELKEIDDILAEAHETGQRMGFSQARKKAKRKVAASQRKAKPKTPATGTKDLPGTKPILSMKPVQNQKALDKALDEVQVKGKRDTMEHGVVFDGTTGKVAAKIDGGPSTIEWSDEALAAISKVKDPVLVHNHPIANSLSEMDIIASLYQNHARVYAISTEPRQAATYAARVFRQADLPAFAGIPAKDFKEEFGWFMNQVGARAAQESVESFFKRAASKAAITEANAARAHSHLLMVALENKGIIEYDVIKLAPAARKALQALGDKERLRLLGRFESLIDEHLRNVGATL